MAYQEEESVGLSGGGGGGWPIRRREESPWDHTHMPTRPTPPHSPADERGDDHTPGGAAAVSAGLLLAVRVAAVRRLLVLTPAATQPEGVEEEEEEVQAQAQQRHGAQQQHRLETQEARGRGGARSSFMYQVASSSNTGDIHTGRSHTLNTRTRRVI